jgi:hypothetical protein
MAELLLEAREAVEEARAAGKDHLVRASGRWPRGLNTYGRDEGTADRTDRTALLVLSPSTTYRKRLSPGAENWSSSRC